MKSEAEDEWRLVERAKRDPEAFGALYDRHVATIYRFVYSRLRSRPDAEDVTSDVFFKALRNLGQYADTGHGFGAWLYRIAANALADRFRSPARSVELDEAFELPTDGQSILDQVVQRERLRLVWASIDRLPTYQRAAFILKYGEDRSIDDISRLMGRSPGAVKLLLCRGMARLRTVLQPREMEVVA